MKNIHKLFDYFLVAMTLFSSCKKDDVDTSPLASLIITNAVVESPQLKLGSAAGPSFNEFKQFGVIAGTKNIYIWPDGDSLNPVLNTTLELADRKIYSLFLAGEFGGTVDPIWIEENLPVHAEKTTGIRFIHLAPSAPHLSIKFVDDPVHQFSDVEYKEKTDFKLYSGNPEDIYNFEVVDNTTGQVLATYSFTPPGYKNITLAITGVAPGDPAINIIQVNHY